MELNRSLKKLSKRFRKIESLEEYQKWKRDIIFLISTIDDKDTLFKFEKTKSCNRVKDYL